MKQFSYLICLIVLLGNCTPTEQLSGVSIDFGDFIEDSNSQLIKDFHFVRLETNDSCLLGAIDQIQVFGNNIYILDSYQTKSIYVFDKQGRYLHKLEGNRRGPGEFLLPLCFFINPEDSTLVVKDHQQSSLFLYALNDLSFISRIPLSDYPISFGILSDNKSFAFYYPDRGDNSYQLRITDEKGKQQKELLPVDPKSKILHGIGQNFYSYRGMLNVFPHFSNTVFEVTPDSITQRYHFYFGKYNFPDDSFFKKNRYKSQVIMGELMNNPYVRLMVPYETDDHLMVKYYVGQQTFVGVYDKKKHHAFNLNPQVIRDTFNWGTFPVPIGSCFNEFIGQLTFDVQRKNNITFPELQQLVKDYSEDCNPILVFYSLRS